MTINGDNRAERKEYFEELYAGDSDPWRYHECEYEIAKRADTLSFLRNRYASGCEVGCSIGVLTADLAPRCARLLAIDISPKAAAIAREALRDFPQVEVAVMHLPYDRPKGTFDLLILSEVLYFFDADELAQLAELARDMTMPGADILIVSYDGETRTMLTGRQATDTFLAKCSVGFELLDSQQREHFHMRHLRRGA
jgi:SAM-dependent methyltransferase